ncbi:hypothetical protein ColLi_10964 [Colletotrichum liriopes]|uniref:Uncharacterized protein n=1 Tax=Colletotrichum liriopes TaxID=708192 RepID=A0AA37GVR1_9PEZI|nr:hypothetical protein ColLi_10964 [Colletotrichum liriopes]
MWTVVDSVLDQSRAISAPNTVGHAVLFEVQRKEVHVKPPRPFDNRIEDDTWARYKEVWRKLVCVWFRTQEMPEDERPPYRLTKTQGELWDAFEGVVEAAVHDGAMHDGAEAPREEVERVGLAMLVSMLDHRLKGGQYENALISALAVMGIRDDGGWVDITDYTTIYSAVIKVARMLVVYQAHLQRKDEVAAIAEKIGVDEAEEEADSLFRHVRRKVQRFMTRTSGDAEAEPTPMDWMLDTRTYGMHIQYSTAAAGMIDWVRDQVSYRRVRFGMGQLSDMMHGAVQEARETLAELTMVGEGEGEGDRLRVALPGIPWSSIEDDHSETQPGYSFLRDDRKTWVSKGEGWVFGRMAASRRLARRWGIHDGAVADEFSAAPAQVNNGAANIFSATAALEYSHVFGRFRELLWLLMHMLGGQPGRATELAGIRHVNTINGGSGTSSHTTGQCASLQHTTRGSGAQGQAKVIHRYLPREVGELLVWYLWLVLPFWQEVQGTVSRSGRYSAYLWADEVLQGEPRQDGKTGLVGSVDPGDSETAAWTWREERLWTTDQEMSKGAASRMPLFVTRLIANPGSLPGGFIARTLNIDKYIL